MNIVNALLTVLVLILVGHGVDLVLRSQERMEQVLVRVEATLGRACVVTCPDCPPFCAGVPGAYFPPKP